MARPKVLLTRRWPETVEARMAEVFDLDLNRADRPLGQEDIRAAMGSYDAILPTVTPAALRISTFSDALSPKAEMIAPAWPMVRPFGAVRPAI